MTCPNKSELNLLVMEVLDPEREAELRAHVNGCFACQKDYEAARRAHFERIRMYDQFDRGHDALREQLIAALPAEPGRSKTDWLARGWRRFGDVVMSTTHQHGARGIAAVLAAAACIALVVSLLVPDQGKSAFAAAIEQFHKAKTIVCRVSSPEPIEVLGMKFEASGKSYLSAEYGSRSELYSNGILVSLTFTPPEGPMTVIQPLARTYMVVDMNQLESNPQRRDHLDAFLRQLQHTGAQADRELGSANIDGVEAVGYEISGKTESSGTITGMRAELWVDPKTGLPVRYLVEIPGLQAGKTLSMVYDQFEWDTPLDPKLFEPDIPANYTRLDATMPAMDETALINGLTRFSELAGKYPKELSMGRVIGELIFTLGAKADNGEKPDQQALAQKSLEIGAACVFYEQLKAEGKTPEYHGKTVKPGQADAVLVRWKLPDGQWRVIYGDLRAETVPADEQ